MPKSVVTEIHMQTMAYCLASPSTLVTNSQIPRMINTIPFIFSVVGGVVSHSVTTICNVKLIKPTVELSEAEPSEKVV